MEKGKVLNIVECATGTSFEKGRELAFNEYKGILQRCYNYVRKKRSSDEQKALTQALKEKGCV